MKKGNQTSALVTGETNIVIQSYLPAGFLVICMVLSNSVQAELRYTISDLGTLGGSTSIGNGINASGQVTGQADTANGQSHAFITNSNGQMIDLGTLGGSNSSGLGINVLGEVTGWSEKAKGGRKAFITSSSGVIKGLSGTYSDLDGTTSQGNAINASGKVTGQISFNYSIRDHACFVTNSNGQMIFLAIGTECIGHGVNDSGLVTGEFSYPNFINKHAFVADNNNKMIANFGFGSSGTSINDSGQVTFVSEYVAGQYVSNVMTINDFQVNWLGSGYVKSINNSGNTVGWNENVSGTRAFLVDNGNMYNLNALLDSTVTNWRLDSANGINDTGQIAGYGYHNGVKRAFLLTPVATSPISAPPINQGSSTPDCPKACVANPINAATGNKFQAETDFVGAPNTGLEMHRFYNSQNSTQSTFGFGWRGSWQQALSNVSGSSTTQITREDGRIETFKKTASGDWQADADVINHLTTLKNPSNQQTGWQLVTRDDAVEVYTLDGRLSTITTRSGMTTVLSYDSQNRLTKVTGHFGYALSFSYDTGNRISSISLPDGSVYQYGYDTRNNLVSVTHPDKSNRQYVYDNSSFNHLLTGIIDENGKRFATWTYDSQGRATSSQHAGGAELTTVAYNTDGSATVTDALGNKHGYNFTTQFDVVKPTSVTGTASKGLGAKAFTYNANGFVASQTDFNGTITTFVRDAGGLETSRTEASGTALARTITTAWHSSFRLPIKITEPNRVITLTYDNSGNLTERTVTAGTDSRTWAFTYNSVGQLLTVDGARTDVNDISQYAYDNQGKLTRVTDALGHATQVTAYNANGQPLSIKDANGLVKTLAYDARGRVTSTQTGVEVTSYVYDAVGQITKTTAADGSTITLSYDDAHRLVKVTDQLGNHLNYSLDAMDNRIKEEVYDPKSNLAQSLTSQFDSLNRLAKKIGAEGQTLAYQYDDNDNPVAMTDPLNNKTTLTYDALNRLVSSIDPAGKEIKTAYDANDNLLSMTDPLTHKTQYGYDGLGNALTIDSPDTGVTTSRVDSAGNKIETIDARGEKVKYSYDILNRISSIQYGNNQTISLTYDQGTNGIGHLTQFTDAAGTTSWTYDSHGRIGSKTFTSGTLSLVTRYGYNTDGSLSTLTYPSGKVVQVTYQNGLVTALDSNSKSLISSVIYRPFGAPAEWVFGNGIKTTRDFDLDGRLVGYDLGDRNRQLSYDAAGRIIGYQDTDMNHDQSFSYDALSRLIGFTSPNSQIDYSYDANSNRTRKVMGTITDDSTFDTASNRLLKNSNPLKDYSYDASGNLISDGSRQFTYDGRGRLSKASGSFGTEQYLINGLGQRLAKVKGNVLDMAGDADQNGLLTASDLRLIVLMAKGTATVNLAGDCNHDGKITTADAICTQAKMADMRINPSKYVQLGTYFMYDEAGHLIGEYNQKGAPIQETVWLGDMPVAVNSGSNNYYVYADHLNAPKAIADELGKIVWRWDSEAFGTTLANEDPDKDGKIFTYNLRFPGQYYDQSTGLHYNGFRDYDPKIGRYIQSDPIGLAGGINTFGYVGGNPLSNNDFFGLKAIIGTTFANDSGHYMEALSATDNPSACTVWAHGTRDSRVDILGTIMGATELNNYLNSNGCRDMPVILHVCNAGKSWSDNPSLVEELAQLEGRTKVTGPNTYIWQKGDSNSPKFNPRIPYPYKDNDTKQWVIKNILTKYYPNYVPGPDLMDPGAWVTSVHK